MNTDKLVARPKLAILKQLRQKGTVQLSIIANLHLKLGYYQVSSATEINLLCFLWNYVYELTKAQPAVVLVLKHLTGLILG